MGFNNWDCKLDPSWHNSVISVQIDADGVNSNDNYIANKIIKTNKDIAAYLGNVSNIKLTSFLIDHGGGDGTMEYFDDEIKKK